ncbi:MAG: Kelch repeat-containing protein [Candidatus Binataceae bacterium]
MHLRGSLQPLAKLIIFMALAIAAAACSGSGSSALIIVPTATPAPTTAPTATATPTPAPTATPSPTPTPPPASFSLTPGQMVAFGRVAFGMAKLQSGKVLIAGGIDIFGNTLSSAELFDPASGNFALTKAPMPGPRKQSTATLLNDGRVLIAGGRDDKNNFLDSALLYDPLSDSFSATASPLTVPRLEHSATLLNDGSVLIAGGFTTPHGGVALPVSSAELFNPTDATFHAVGSMSDPRAQHTATLLADGSVMVAGGISVKLGQLASAELYNPSTGSFTPTGSLATARTGAAAVRLTDGRILVAGGGGNSGALKSAELYDSATGKFSPASNDMPEPHYLAAIALLPDSSVLIAGGFAGSGIFFVLNAQAAATIFDPGSSSFTATTSLNMSRSDIGAALLDDGRVFIPGGQNFQGESLANADLYDTASPGGRFAGLGIAISGGMHSERVDQRALTLNDGKILITGGIDGLGNLAQTAEIYDPASGNLTLTNTPMTIGRSGHTMTMLKSGLILVAGGGTDTAELYDPAAGSFTATAGKMSVARLHHTATLLGDGTVLIAGGVSKETTPALQSAELYDPASNSFTPIAAPMQSARVFHVAALLPNGTVLIAGGSDKDDSSNGATDSAEIYDPVAKTFTITANTMSAQRYAPTATMLSDGSVLIVDGAAVTTTTASADLFNPASGRFFPTTGTPTAARFFHSAALLSDGTVLIVGGVNNTSGLLNSSEIYDPATETFKPSASTIYGRSEFTESVLSDGDVLIAGGAGTNRYALPSTELFVP